MQEVILALALGIPASLLVGAVGMRFYLAHKVGAQLSSAQQSAQQILDDARKESETIRKEADLEAKEQIFQRTKQMEKEAQRKRSEADRIEGRLRNKERTLDQKIESFERREKSLSDKEKSIDSKLERIGNRERDLAQQEEVLRRKAEEISGYTAEEARRYLLESLEQEVRQESAAVLRRVENETKEIAQRKARQVITLAIQKCATEQVTESTCSVLTIPSEDMKGRIIGREGRNIRALEAATGVNLIVDDTPEAIVLSCFDPLRREIARLSLEKLLGDGRIHPARIEDVVKKRSEERRGGE